MPLYRVTFQTELLVECNNERDAERIGFFNLVNEIQNGTYEFSSIELIEELNQLRSDERGTLPWKDFNRRNDPEITVEEILEMKMK